MTGFKFNQSQDTILQPCPYSDYSPYLILWPLWENQGLSEQASVWSGLQQVIIALSGPLNASVNMNLSDTEPRLLLQLSQPLEIAQKLSMSMFKILLLISVLVLHDFHLYSTTF